MIPDIQKLKSQYLSNERSVSDVAQAVTERIDTLNPKLNCFIHQGDHSYVTLRAQELDKRKDEIQNLPLYGVPIGVKDNFLIQGQTASAGSKILENYKSTYTATCLENLLRAGALLVPNANCDEFAMGSSNENSAYGPCYNPWNTEHVSGGSSGGSAVCVASRMTTASLGTDTGGSIRQPASLCGVVGLKPTYGRVSRFGVIAFASSLDQVGPLSQSVYDSALVSESLFGYDTLDGTSSSRPVPMFTKELEKIEDLKGKKIGVLEQAVNGVDEEVKKAIDESKKIFEELGAELVPVKLPHFDYALATYYLVATSEASSNLARYDGVHYGYRSQDAKSLDEVYRFSRSEGFGQEVKLRIMLGTFALSAGYYEAYYGKAQKVRALIKQDYAKAFEKCDVILSPTSPSTAFKLNEKSSDPLQMYLSDICTIPVNLAGVPAMAIPSHISSKGLPVGIQLTASHFDESQLFQFGHLYEKTRGALPSISEKLS